MFQFVQVFCFRPHTIYKNKFVVLLFTKHRQCYLVSFLYAILHFSDTKIKPD